jgi:hypothetical protein
LKFTGEGLPAARHHQQSQGRAGSPSSNAIDAQAAKAEGQAAENFEFQISNCHVQA